MSIKSSLLLSHAGISAIAEGREPSHRPEFMLNDFVKAEEEILQGNFSHELLQAGRMRGGIAKVGGIYWLDWSEMQPFNSFTQVVGHTFYQGSKPLVKMNDNLRPRAYCIDNGLRQIMIWKKGKLQHHTLLELDGEQ
jgi:hypothetical protein